MNLRYKGNEIQVQQYLRHLMSWYRWIRQSIGQHIGCQIQILALIVVSHSNIDLLVDWLEEYLWCRILCWTLRAGLSLILYPKSSQSDDDNTGTTGTYEEHWKCIGGECSVWGFPIYILLLYWRNIGRWILDCKGYTPQLAAGRTYSYKCCLYW